MLYSNSTLSTEALQEKNEKDRGLRFASLVAWYLVSDSCIFISAHQWLILTGASVKYEKKIAMAIILDITHSMRYAKI